MFVIIRSRLLNLKVSSVLHSFFLVILVMVIVKLYKKTLKKNILHGFFEIMLVFPKGVLIYWAITNIH